MNNIIETAEKLLKKEREYRDFIGEEHKELAIAAANRGWKSTRYERGVEMREEIAVLQEEWDREKLKKNDFVLIKGRYDELQEKLRNGVEVLGYFTLPPLNEFAVRQPSDFKTGYWTKITSGPAEDFMKECERLNVEWLVPFDACFYRKVD
jgi:hypothetical protein